MAEFFSEEEMQAAKKIEEELRAVYEELKPYFEEERAHSLSHTGAEGALALGFLRDKADMVYGTLLKGETLRNWNEIKGFKPPEITR